MADQPYFEYVEFRMNIDEMNQYGSLGWRYMFTYASQGNDAGTLYVVMGRRHA